MTTRASAAHGRGVMTAATATTRELAVRERDGVRVLLLWHPREDVLTVSVDDAHAGHGFELTVQRERALDAFYHPFAYAA